MTDIEIDDVLATLDNLKDPKDEYDWVHKAAETIRSLRLKIGELEKEVSAGSSDRSEPGNVGSVTLPDGCRLGEFSPCVDYNEELRLTMVLLKDASIVWTSIGMPHFLDLGYDMQTGDLVGVQIWSDVRTHKLAQELSARVTAGSSQSGGGSALEPVLPTVDQGEK